MSNEYKKGENKMNYFRSCIKKGLSLSVWLMIFQFAVVFSSFAADYVCYVDINWGDNANSGNSPAEAKKTLGGVLTDWVNSLPTPTSADTITINMKAGNYFIGSMEELDVVHSIPSLPVSAFSIIGDERGGTVLDGSGAQTWTTGLEVSSDNVTIKGIEFTGFSTGILVQPSSYSTSALLTKNKIYNVSNGIVVNASDNNTSAVISDNKLFNVETGIIIISNSANATASIYNNVMYGFTMAESPCAIRIDNQSVSAGAIDAKVLFNTIDGNGNRDVKGIVLLAEPTSNEFSAQISFNNLTNFTAFGIEKDTDLDGKTISVSYNNFYNTSSNSSNINDPNAITGNPFYMNPSAGNFSIPSDSPCVDKIPNTVAETALSGIITDFTGLTRPKQINDAAQQYDIGAYEYFAVNHIRYVDVINGSPDNDGLTLETAWKNFSDALSKCGAIRTSADYNMTLYLAQGEYSVANGEEQSMHVVPLDNMAIKGMTSEGVIIRGDNDWTTGLSIKNNNITITELTFYGFSDTGILIGSSENVKILTCSITSCGTGIGVVPDMTDEPSSPEILCNEIKDFTAYGIKIVSNAAAASPLIKDNRIVLGEEAKKSKFTQMPGALVGIDIESYSEASPEIIQNKIVNSIISGDSVYGIRAVISGGMSSPLIRANLFSGLVQSIYFNSSASTGTLNPVMTNNLIRDVVFLAGTASVSFNLSYGECAPELYHNTIDGSSAGETGIYFSQATGSNLNPVIKYNLVTNFTQSGIKNDSTDPATIAAADFVYNNAYGNGNNAETDNYAGLSKPASNLQSDPLYAIDPETGTTDFSIPANSPCVDQIPVEENDFVRGDIIGTSRQRPSSATALANSDIGAYEYPYMNYQFTMPGGDGLATDYRLLTLPLDYHDGGLLTLFEEKYGTYDNTAWRIFTYDAANADYVEINETLFGDLGKRGNAFWVISTDGAFTSDTQTFEGGLIRDTEDFKIEFDQGWHLIALPWPKAKQDDDVKLGDLRVDGEQGAYRLLSADQTMTDPCLWSYEPDNAEAAATNGYIKIEDPAYSMVIGKGYWLKVNVNFVVISIPPPTHENQATKKNIKVRSGSKVYQVPPAPPAAAGIYSVAGGNGCFINATR